jgi:hypothetical protein
MLGQRFHHECDHRAKENRHAERKMALVVSAVVGYF